ncbi:MAG: hypothetical protein R3F24_02045 [Gammaproteobacteria bacterium]
MSHRPVRLNRPRASTARCARRFHVALACIGAVSLPMPALAYWQLIPQVDAGITYEDNPRYLSDEQKKAQDALQSGSAMLYWAPSWTFDSKEAGRRQPARSG